MSDKSVLVANLADSKVLICGGYRHPENGLHVETQPVGIDEPKRRSVPVWSLTFRNQRVAAEVFRAFFDLTTEEAIGHDQRRGVIEGDNALKVEAAN